MPAKIRRIYNLSRYSLTCKVSAIWRMDRGGREQVHLMDFPSTGDTAFPAIAPLRMPFRRMTVAKRVIFAERHRL